MNIINGVYVLNDEKPFLKLLVLNVNGSEPKMFLREVSCMKYMSSFWILESIQRLLNHIKKFVQIS